MRRARGSVSALLGRVVFYAAWQSRALPMVDSKRHQRKRAQRAATTPGVEPEILLDHAAFL